MRVATTALEKIPSEQREHLKGYTQDAILKTYYRHRELGWDEYGYINTGKPNAVIIQPTKDENGAFSHPTTLGFVKRLKEHYDLVLRVVELENDAYRSISAVPSPELVVISGHGLPGLLSFGAEKKEARKAKEELLLDVKDCEFASSIKDAHPEATIFLYSCYSKRLVNFVKKNSGNRTVIGAKTPFATEDILVRSYYPLDIRIIREYKLPLLPTIRRDVTYIL